MYLRTYEINIKRQNRQTLALTNQRDDVHYERGVSIDEEEDGECIPSSPPYEYDLV
jgi:hypothetical protein